MLSFYHKMQSVAQIPYENCVLESCGMFTDFLAYKMERAGKKLVRIDRWYPSSKTCSCCGNIKEDLQLSDRIYECACGNRMDRDQNAAINICREGIRISGMMPDIEKKIS